MIKRTLFEDLKSHLAKPEMSFIVGPRQAGKTTLMLLLKEYAEKQGSGTLFLNLDIESERQHLVSQSALVKKIQLEFGRNKGVVFLDEIQRKADAGLFLKGIYDMHLPHKFVVSGSGSIELKEKIHESLVGRKRMFELPTVTFEEFAQYKTNYKYERKLRDFFEIEKEKIAELLEEYLNFGGYPRVVLEETSAGKRRIIDEIYQSYLERDIAYLLGIQKTESFTHLVKIMASQIGNFVTISELSSTLGIAAKTIAQYLWYLEKTFILKKITPYFKNIRKEITKTPIFYFYDLGLRNYAAGEFGNAAVSRSAGFIFENFIANILFERTAHTGSDIHFWRTKDGAAVDFILESGRGPIPIEVKYRPVQPGEVTRSLKSFIVKYRPSRALIIHLGPRGAARIGATAIDYLPFYEALFTDFCDS